MKRIKINFFDFLAETEKAFLFEDYKGNEYWLPKSICDLVKQKKGLK